MGSYNKLPCFIGRRFSSLLVKELSLNNSTSDIHYVCECDCGNIKIAKATVLNNGKMKSCGCQKAGYQNRKLSAKDSSYNDLINMYKQSARRDNRKWTLTRDDAIKLFNDICFYCKTPPVNPYNNKISKKGSHKKKSCIERNVTGWILYNGIDRIDSKKDYSVDNVVTSCKTCNFGKMAQSQYDFLRWIELIKKHNIIKTTKIPVIDLLKDASYTALIGQYKKNAEYRLFEWDIKRNEAISLFQNNCYYCGSEPTKRFNPYLTSDGKLKGTNNFNKALDKTIFYNGIDRKDPSKGYSLLNCVTACYTCNMAKNKMTEQQFIDWIYNLKSRCKTL